MQKTWANQSEHRHQLQVSSSQSKGGFAVTGQRKKEKGTWICLLKQKEKVLLENVDI